VTPPGKTKGGGQTAADVAAVLTNLRENPPISFSGRNGVHPVLALEDVESMVAGEDWPTPPADAAFRGIAGDLVRLVAPCTEGDPAAILVGFLVLAGNAIGRSAHYLVGPSAHYCNTYAVIVGPSGTGRKGTAYDEARRPFDMLSAGLASRDRGGVTSGEGIIYHVRDATTKREKANGVEIEVPDDSGIADKRLVLREAEFSQVLKVASRDSNTTSVTLREAWDGRPVLETLAKNAHTTATGAHVSMIGDITPSELRRELTATDKANGFANRIIWCCSRRSQELPDPPQVDPIPLRRLVDRLDEALRASRGMGSVVRDAGASELWRRSYSSLTRERPGLLGVLLARSDAQVVRLSLIYAVLDGSPDIQREHLEAALAVWDYSERSARWIFGDTLGDPLADEILVFLRYQHGEWVSRSGIGSHFSWHRDKAALDRALALLRSTGFVETEKVSTGGRPVQRWRAHMTDGGGA
jgi:hypothetical protein